MPGSKGYGLKQMKDICNANRLYTVRLQHLDNNDYMSTSMATPCSHEDAELHFARDGQQVKVSLFSSFATFAMFSSADRNGGLGQASLT